MTTSLDTVELLDDAAPEARTPLTTDALRMPMHALAIARAEKAKVDELVKLKRAAFEQANAELLALAKAAAATLASLEGEARLLAADVYRDTQEKKPVPGVEIKHYDVITIADPDAALAWARKSGMALIPESLDVGALTKIASVTPLPFMTYTSEARVTLGTKLDPAAYVPDAPADTAHTSKGV